jgi:oligosaccharide repeat unit polymerase
MFKKRADAFLNWWARPHYILLFLVLPVFLLCGTMTAEDFYQYQVYSFYITRGNFIMGLVAMAVLVSTIMMGMSGVEKPSPAPQLDKIPEKTYIKVTARVGFIVLFAYTIFMLPVVSHPQMVIDLFHGSQTAMYDLRDTLNAIPGLTSFVNLQALYVVMYLLFGVIYKKPAPLILQRIFTLMLVFCVLRMFLWSERIAIMEFAIPYIIIRFGTKPSTPAMRKLFALAPVYGIAALVVVFATGEYFRSWQFYSEQGNTTFGSFIISRLCGYYATAINNILGFYELSGPWYQPILTGHWIYKLPFAYDLGIRSNPAMLDFLDTDLNPEFNNPSGLYSPIQDFGLPLGMVTWAILGLMVGRVYRNFAQGKLFGLLLYPTAFIGLVEILRIFYWGNSRYFPTIVTTIIVWAILKKYVPAPRLGLEKDPLRSVDTPGWQPIPFKQPGWFKIFKRFA